MNEENDGNGEGSKRQALGQGVGSRSELLNVLGEVKARVQDKLGIDGLPMPQFILIGNQSVGKSRLIEALAGETFNFISGSLGSRRPTVLEFRNVAANRTSKWHMRNRTTQQWSEVTVQTVMTEVGKAHEELGDTISSDPVYVRIESPVCVDMQIVDLPGFRDFSIDESRKHLSASIHELVTGFMRDPNNVMLCVEQAGDASTMSTLQKCREIDPRFERTILIRNKLDKYYGDLSRANVNQWVQGFEDLPSDMTRPMRFAFTLPFWSEGTSCPRPFTQLRDETANEDVMIMKQKGLSEGHLKYIGFGNFVAHMENKIEVMFSESINPVLTKLTKLKDTTATESKALQVEFVETDPHKILSTARDCGISFATALTHVMEGILDSTPVMSLEQELKAFHKHHDAIDSKHFCMLPSENFPALEDYTAYLRDEMRIPTFDVELNGGAQFRRMLIEVEIFLRFSEMSVETTKRDVIQARGVSMGSLTWRDVVVKLLSNGAHLPLQRRIGYVGERIKWFFEQQKEAVLEFMAGLEHTPSGKLYSPLYAKHARLIKQNATIKHLVFQTYDNACARQLKHFTELFDNMLTSTFSNPWVFLKGATTNSDQSKILEDAVLPSFDDTKERLPKEIQSRSSIDQQLSRWLQEIPTESNQIDEAVDRVQMLVLKTYGFIRSQVCDQVELFSESFFKLPMLRRLEQDMAITELNETDTKNYHEQRERLTAKMNRACTGLDEISDCIARLQSFKIKSESRM
jgi:GTPase SAR1 family protein